LAKHSHGSDEATGFTDPAAVDELFQQAYSSTAWANTMAGHIKICAATAQTSQRHRALKM